MPPLRARLLQQVTPGQADRSARGGADARRVYGRRRAVAGTVLLAVIAAAVVAVAGGGGGQSVAPVAAPETAPPELPGGGRELFPAYRVVGFFGAPQDEALGVLGIGTPAQAARRLRRQAKPYASGERPVLLAFELVASIATAAPGPDGLHRTRQKPRVVRTYLDAAREAGALLILDIQPGQANFMREVRPLERFLVEPDVGLALDPEWRMGPGEIPGQAIGSVEAAEVNRIARYLGDLVERHDLPEKLLLVHKFTDEMIRHSRSLDAPPGIAVTVNVDGFGERSLKKAKYREFVGGDGLPDGLHTGIKLFYEEDQGLLGPREVLALRPSPDVVVYE